MAANQLGEWIQNSSVESGNYVLLYGDDLKERENTGALTLVKCCAESEYDIYLSQELLENVQIEMVILVASNMHTAYNTISFRNDVPQGSFLVWFLLLFVKMLVHIREKIV